MIPDAAVAALLAVDSTGPPCTLVAAGVRVDRMKRRLRASRAPIPSPSVAGRDDVLLAGRVDD